MTKVLIIEDDADQRAMLREVLERSGFDVADAADGNAGLALQRRSPADVVITDLLMPDKEGIETIMELRKLYPSTKIIAITGYGSRHKDADYLLVAREVGANATLKKPFSPAQLIVAVREVLEAS